MENTEIFSEKYHLSSLVKADNLNNYLSWIGNPFENSLIFNAKNDYSINMPCTFKNLSKIEEDSTLLGFMIKRVKNLSET